MMKRYLCAFGLVMSAACGEEVTVPHEDGTTGGATSASPSTSSTGATEASDDAAPTGAESDASTGAGSSSSGEETTGSTGGTGEPGFCGDGELDPDEACDDGNDVASDGCESDCTVSEGAAEVVAGSYHSCARFHDGAVRCWGRQDEGQLGYPELAGESTSLQSPVDLGDVDVGGPAVDIDAGWKHTCAILEGGAVRCWGANDLGQLGYGYTTSRPDYWGPTDDGDVDLGGVAAVQVAAGLDHTCALLEGGAVKCWGHTGYLGIASNTGGPFSDPSVLGEVELGGAAVQIAVGFSHTCALLDDGTLRCWGSGELGALGYGNTDWVGDDETPEDAGPVDVGGDVVGVSANFGHTCAVLDGGSVRCWGANFSGQLGYGHTETIGDDEAPAAAAHVDVGDTVEAIACGVQHTCAVLTGGAVKCWGLGGYGGLGYADDESIGDDETPASVGTVDVGGTVTGLELGDFHTCARLDDSAVRCWGWSWYQQLGHAGLLGDIGDDEPPSAAGDVPLF